MGERPDHRDGLWGARVGDPISEALTRDAVVSRLFGKQPPQAEIGRYQLERRRGAGGAGVVYEAFDPELERRVAIKLLWGSLEGGDRGAAQSRLLREARALAMIRHPNVVEVYDVGIYDGLVMHGGTSGPHEQGVYLVMELVDGIDGSRWLADDSRSVARICEVFIGAGRGLCAAHDAGIVHRDFKPANVLVADDGRPRVVDFGLARRPKGPGERSSDSSGASGLRPRTDPDGLHESFARDLTGAGNVVGTPRYMAPEQLAGDRVDARSDQYAFCTTMFFALYGRPPFSAATFKELGRAKRSGKIDPPPERPDLPAAVFAVLRRGLDPDPARRYPSLRAALGALEQALGRRRRRVIAIGGTVTAGLLAAATAAAGWNAAAPRPCSGAVARVDALWSPQTKAAIHTAFADAAPKWGPRAADRVTSKVQARVDAWRERWDGACESAPATAAADRRRACLLQQVDAMQDGVVLLAAGDAKIVRDADAVVERLPPADACDADPQVIAAPEVVALHHRLDEAAARGEHGHTDEAIAAMTELLGEAEALGDRAVVARVLIARSRAADATGRSAPARADAEAAYHAALDDGALALAFEGARLAALGFGADMRTADEATAWLRRAESLLPQIEDSDPQRRGLLRARARLAFASGDYDTAAARMAEALDGAVEDLELAAALENYSATLSWAGRPDDALAQADRGLAIRERELGPDHPALIGGLEARASALRRLDRYDEAIAALQRASEIASEIAGDDDASSGMSVMLSLAINYDDVGRLGEAEAAYREVLALAQGGAVEPDSQEMGSIHQNLGVNLLMQGRIDDARESFERARAIWEVALGAEHAEVARVWRMLGEVHTAAGDLDDALAAFARAQEILERTVGADHPRMVTLLFRIALLHHARDDAQAAQAAIRRAAAAARAVLPTDHPDVARAEILAVYLGSAPDGADPLVVLADATARLPAGDLDQEYTGYARFAASRVQMTRGDRAAAWTALREAIDHLQRAGPAAARGLDLARRSAATL